MTPLEHARRAALALFASTVVLACASDGIGSPRELEGRLLAPCCWIQTLDVHESPEASALRVEITDRFERGEASASIEEELVARYGARIRAVPSGHDPRSAMTALVGVAAVASLLGVFLTVRQWTRRARAHAPSAPMDEPGARAPDEYDRRIDDELRRLDDA